MCWPAPSNRSSLSSEWGVQQGQGSCFSPLLYPQPPSYYLAQSRCLTNSSQTNVTHTHAHTPENFPMPQLRVREPFFLSLTILASSIIPLIIWYFNCSLFPLLDFLEGPGFNLVTIKTQSLPFAAPENICWLSLLNLSVIHLFPYFNKKEKMTSINILECL